MCEAKSDKLGVVLPWRLGLVVWGCGGAHEHGAGLLVICLSSQPGCRFLLQSAVKTIEAFWLKKTFKFIESIG